MLSKIAPTFVMLITVLVLAGCYTATGINSHDPRWIGAPGIAKNNEARVPKWDTKVMAAEQLQQMEQHCIYGPQKCELDSPVVDGLQIDGVQIRTVGSHYWWQCDTGMWALSSIAYQTNVLLAMQKDVLLIGRIKGERPQIIPQGSGAWATPTICDQLFVTLPNSLVMGGAVVGGSAILAKGYVDGQRQLRLGQERRNPDQTINHNENGNDIDIDVKSGGGKPPHGGGHGNKKY